MDEYPSPKDFTRDKPGFKKRVTVNNGAQLINENGKGWDSAPF